MNKIFWATLFVLPLLASVANAEPISVHGSTVFVAAALDPNKEAIEKETGLTLDVVGNSAGLGVEELAKGKADIAMITGKLEGLVTKINDKNPGLVDLASLKTFEVGTTHVVFAVHPTNPVKALTREQLTSILKGTTENWKEVGGEDKPIVLVTGIAATGLRSAVEKEYLNGASVTDKARTLAQSSLIAAVVEKMPTAIGIVVTEMVTPKMTEIKLDKVEDIKLSYVTKGEPSTAAKKLIDATIKLTKK